ncbi:MAG TPA: hypothetical protein H9811_08620 [Candidatus Gemmiger excrementigallinarum]|uniref:Uncharacterized protein n=1 Tax=Candidatus Gemmiger excrementigallinarum TaxID=2838609 RepID=A0A9D2JBG6_9FIRM|nr:hypothetical protein [Candidatus Gemmiger excrementigallinarum]
MRRWWYWGAGAGEVEQAHECGLSYGKYRAYRELAALDPTVTPEAVQGMTMREIRDRIAALTGDASTQSAAGNPADCENPTPQNGNGHHGGGHHGTS